MKKLLIVGLLLGTASPAFAQYGFSYQPDGNYYRTNSNAYGSSTYGGNARTGASWYSRSDNSGSTRGFDSKGNTWSYNQNTGIYMNSNGTVRTGRGRYRTSW